MASLSFNISNEVVGDTIIQMHRRLDWLLPSWLEDADAYDQSIDEDMLTVYYTIAVNLIILGFCLMFFSIYRMYDDKTFAPKCEMFPDRTPKKLDNSSLFGWISELYNIDDNIIIDKGGYDILFLVRFYRLSLKIFLSFAIYAWGILLPINGTGGADTDENSFDLWSMTNIQQGSSRCWYHLVGIYLLTGITIYFLEKEFVVYAKHRHVYLRQRHAHLRTVLVEGIPHKMRSTVTLAMYFETLYPNAVLSVKVGQDLRYLDRLVEQRLNAVTQLERNLYAHHLGKNRPTVRVGNMMENIDAIRYYTHILDDLNEVITKEQESARRLAMYVDRISGTTAINVIEGFLKVTEIGSVKRFLKEKTGSSNKWLLRNRVGSGKDLSDKQPIIVDISSVDTNVNRVKSNYKSFDGTTYDGEVSDVKKSNFVLYKMTWTEWFWAMSSSPSWMDCWRVLKEGRNAEDHEHLNEEETALISPPEERRMFLSKAFVTFKTFTAATTARQVVHMQLAGHMAICEAPEPTDITWMNLYSTRTGTFWRRFFVEVAVLLLFIVWVAPVTLISFVVSEDALRSYSPYIDEWCDESLLIQSAVELIQPGALVALMTFLPPVLSLLGVMEGCISFSSNQFRAFDRYFTFQIINVFLVTTIAGSVIDCIRDIYEDPSSTFSLLGTSLPKMGGFFTNYLIIKAFTGLGMEIMRLAAFCSAIAKLLFTSNATLRDRTAQVLFGSIRGMRNPGWFPFSKVYAQDILLVVVCATYACIAPLILVPGLCYFFGASLVYKHQNLFVYEPIYETGGKWWPRMARCFVVALLFAQATMVGMMILKQTYTEIYFLAAIIVSTALYYWYMSQLYVPLAAQLPYDMATSMDLDQQNFPDELAGADQYVQPSLRAGIIKPMLDYDEDNGGDDDNITKTSAVI